MALTPAQINKQQRDDADKQLARAATKTEAMRSVVAPASKTAARPAAAPPPSAKTTAMATTAHAPLPAVPGERTRQSFLDEIAPASITGNIMKFDTKAGRHFTPHDDATIDGETVFVALCDQTIAGYVHFNGPGNPPDRHMGLIYDGFVVPKRADMGDDDPALWEPGLSGEPDDPWPLHVYVPMQNTETNEVNTFIATTKTARLAVGKLLQHYDRTLKTDAGHYPLIQLKVGGFKHKDPRVGWVHTPVLAIVGKYPRADAATPTSPPADFNDELPY
jgi:hypothetical protein